MFNCISITFAEIKNDDFCEILKIMIEDKAVGYFHGKEHYNCAQAILKAFQKEFCITEEEIIRAAQKGSGRAEEGFCGALYGAKYLVRDEILQHKLCVAFKKEAGALQCWQIRKIGKLTCRKCVRLAASKVKELLL